MKIPYFQHPPVSPPSLPCCTSVLKTRSLVKSFGNELEDIPILELVSIYFNRDFRSRKIPRERTDNLCNLLTLCNFPLLLFLSLFPRRFLSSPILLQVFRNARKFSFKIVKKWIVSTRVEQSRDKCHTRDMLGNHNYSYPLLQRAVKEAAAVFVTGAPRSNNVVSLCWTPFPGRGNSFARRNNNSENLQ